MQPAVNCSDGLIWIQNSRIKKNRSARSKLIKLVARINLSLIQEFVIEQIEIAALALRFFYPRGYRICGYNSQACSLKQVDWPVSGCVTVDTEDDLSSKRH